MGPLSKCGLMQCVQNQNLGKQCRPIADTAKCSLISVRTVLKYMNFCKNKKLDIPEMTNEPPHDKTNKMACVPSEDLDQPGHLPSLIRAFSVRMKKAWVLSYPLSTQRRLIRLADAQADLRLRWAHMLIWWFCHEAAQMDSYSMQR